MLFIVPVISVSSAECSYKPISISAYLPNLARTLAWNGHRLGFTPLAVRSAGPRKAFTAS